MGEEVVPSAPPLPAGPSNMPQVLRGENYELMFFVPWGSHLESGQEMIFKDFLVPRLGLPWQSPFP